MTAIVCCARCQHARPHRAKGMCRSCYIATLRVRGARDTRGSRTEPPDPIAVERACRGEFLPLNAAERLEAVRRLAARGVSIQETARLLRMSSRSVSRLRQHRKAA